MQNPHHLLLFVAALGLAGCTTQTRGQGALDLDLADTALSSGAPGLALQVSEAVLAQRPHDTAALLRQGDAYYQLGEGAKATMSYEQTLKVQPRSVGAQLGLGRIALATDPNDAEARFSQVLKLDPTNQAAYSDRGIAFDLIGHHADAQADYRLAIAEGGDNTATEVDLALSLAMSGDSAKAVRILQPIATSPDATARARQDLALALVLDGRTEEAANLLLTQMSPADARNAVAAYRALRDQPLTPALLEGGS